MIQHDQFTKEMKLISQRHPATGASQHRRAGRRGEIQPIMGLARLAIQDPLAAENARNPPRGGADKTLGKAGQVGFLRADRSQFFPFARNAGQGFGIWRHLRGRQAGNALGWPLALGDVQHAGFRRTCGRADHQPRLGRMVAPKAKGEIPRR